jgi:hypothetical protein
MLSSLGVIIFPIQAVAGVLIFAGVAILLGQQVQKELSRTECISQKMLVFGQVVVIGVIPLLIAFLLVAILQL